MLHTQVLIHGTRSHEKQMVGAMKGQLVIKAGQRMQKKK